MELLSGIEKISQLIDWLILIIINSLSIRLICLEPFLPKQNKLH